MPGTIKNLTIQHHRLNESDSFTGGDTLTGQILLDVNKELRIATLSIQFTGRAVVKWEEKLGRSSTLCYATDYYLLSKNFYVRDRKPKEEDQYAPLLMDECGRPYSSCVAPGCHVYPFTFQFLDQDMPPPFRGQFGKIVYALEANLSRSMRMDSKAKTELNFVPKAVVSNIHQLMAPQRRSTEKQMKLLTSGSVAVNVNIDKMGYCQGEGMHVVASVRNDSSGDTRLLYHLCRGDSFLVQNHQTRHKIQAVLEEVGDVIPAQTHQTVTRTLTIPPQITPSILNCKIIKVEYWLKVFLKVKFTSNPEVILPLVILPFPGPPAPDQPLHYSDLEHEARPEQLPLYSDLEHEARPDRLPLYVDLEHEARPDRLPLYVDLEHESRPDRPPHYSDLEHESFRTCRCEASGAPGGHPAWTPKTTDQWKDLEAALDALSQCAASPSPSCSTDRSSDV